MATLLRRVMRWARYSPLIALLTAGAQILGEGLRWQMIPAYALSGLFFLVGLWQGGKPANAVSRWGWIKGLAIL